MNIAFAHNVQYRHKTLRETIEMERKFFPNCKIYVAYNTTDFNLKYFEDLDNIVFTYFKGDGHKIGCVNGCITAVNDALSDPDNEVIVFSHDDVKINPYYIETFKKNVLDIVVGNHNVICRRPHSYGDNYCMMEGFFMSSTSAYEIFKNHFQYISDIQLPLDLRKSPSPEVWLYELVNINGIKVNTIDYIHADNNYNKVLAQNLGLHHKNAGLRGWND